MSSNNSSGSSSKSNKGNQSMIAAGSSINHKLTADKMADGDATNSTHQLNSKKSKLDDSMLTAAASPSCASPFSSISFPDSLASRSPLSTSTVAHLTAFFPIAHQWNVFFPGFLRSSLATLPVRLQQAREELRELEGKKRNEHHHIEADRTRMAELEKIIAAVSASLNCAEQQHELIQRRHQVQPIFKLLQPTANTTNTQLCFSLASAMATCYQSKILAEIHGVSGALGTLARLMHAWQPEAEEMLQQLAATLTADDIQSEPHLIATCLVAGDISTVKHLLTKAGDGAVIDWNEANAYLLHLTLYPTSYSIDFIPILQFIPHGLDPNYLSSSTSESALELARKYVKEQPHSHNQFMHSMLAAWQSHSHSVRMMLAAPHVLIPELANICAEYLDLDK